MGTRQIIARLLPALCLPGCSTTIPANPSSGPAQPNPISNTSPQPSEEKPGAELKDTALDKNDEPTKDYNIETKEDTGELATVTDTSGTFSVRIQRGSQQIIINCDKYQIYQKEESPARISKTDEFEQTLTIRRE